MEEKPFIRISVRKLVEFILRSGDIDNRHIMAPEKAMVEGGRIHRMLQRRMGSNYEAEVTLRLKLEYEEYTVSVEGRADGIFWEKEYGDSQAHLVSQISFLEQHELRTEEMERINIITIDEIKGTYSDLRKIRKPTAVHLAQAKCYAYFYALQHELKYIRVRMTYCHLETEEIKYFYEEYTFLQLKTWFEGVMEEYKKWMDYEIQWKRKRQTSIGRLVFPFPYREGQKELVSHVYRTIYHKKKLFMAAPTGVGKTISTLFPAVQAMGKNMGEKIFYLTAKTITRTVADEAFELLRQGGLLMKTVVLTAKEKICPLDETECNPGACPYARGHYDRINEAVYALLMGADRYTRDLIETYAGKYQVCPFELGLDMSLFADGIIGDYNYVFDPHAYLKRFFGDGVEGDYIFLIDEAHNLLERGRDMYSALLCKEEFQRMAKLVSPIDQRLERYLEKCSKEMLLLKRECGEFKITKNITSFVTALNRLYSAVEKSMQENTAWYHMGKIDRTEIEKQINQSLDLEEMTIRGDTSARKELLDFYFEISHFLEMYEGMDDNYVIYSELHSDGLFSLKLFCMNPAVNLQECMGKARSTILFSATLIPIQYYKNLLGGTAEDYEVYAKSTFNPEKRRLFIGSDITSRYSKRTEEGFIHYAAYIHEIVKNRHGNYMIFFPSHSFLQAVYAEYMKYYYEEQQVECILQSDYMKESEREEFLQRFAGNEDWNLSEAIQMEIELEEKSLLGFCIMGGIFSEGIDLTEDKLIGAILVGTGLPQVCHERELLREYFDGQGESGFDYAYRFPGMNKVLQAAGRVIRTDKDVGIVALLDERFLQHSYQKLFPEEWLEYEMVIKESIGKRVERFWDEWL